MNDEKQKATTDELLRVVPAHIRNPLARAIYGYADKVQEITLRNGRPVCVYLNGDQMFLTQNGCLTYIHNSQPLVISSSKDITDCFNVSCGYSVYSHLNEIKEGFITINGGHRVGLCGSAVVSNGNIVNIRDISTLSLRFAREVPDCGKEVYSILAKSKSGLLLCGSPCSGKTTVLRDVARILSSKSNCRAAVVDTRGEIAATHCGINQMDVGMCDVLNGYPRSIGIAQSVRVLSPQYVICDELGKDEDVSAVLSGVNSGVRFVCSIHASNKEELLRRKNACEILNTGAFEKIVFLKGREYPGQISSVFDVQEVLNG